MKINIPYIWERIYPHFISLCTTICLMFLEFNPIQSANIALLIEGIVTLDSIIIGFIGAIIPIVLSMKNESKIVKYIFSRDKKGLFKKYTLETVAYGLVDVCVSLSVYVIDLISNKYALLVLRWLFLYVFIIFILSTYRSLTCMLKIIFADDKQIETKHIIKLGKDEKEDLWNKKGK